MYLVAELLRIANQIERRPTVGPEKIVTEIRGLVAKSIWDGLSDLQRGAAFGSCNMTPTAGAWDELPREVQEAVSNAVVSWMELVAQGQQALEITV